MMMRNIILPEKIGTHRLFAVRVLSIMMQEDAVRGCIVLLKGNSSIVQKLLEVSYGQEINGTTLSQEEALVNVVTQAGKVDEIRVVIPATLAIIKELEVPFIDREKIRLVIDAEVEPLLPFSLDEAVIDFIVTKENKNLQSSHILVAAMRKQDLAVALEPYEQQSINVNTVTIDFFATYGLYQRIPTYHSSSNSTAIVDIGLHGTRITFLQNNQLKLTRYINQGLQLILNHLSNESGKDKKEVFEYLQEYGVKIFDEDTTLAKAAQQKIMDFFNEIQFTLNSFSLKLNDYEGVNKILFVGNASTMPHLISFSTKLLQISSELFNAQTIFENKNIKNGNPKDTTKSWQAFVNPLGASLGPIEFEDFNLRRQEFAFFDITLSLRQFFVFLFLLVITFCCIGFIGYSQISTLRKTAQSLEYDQKERLNGLLPRKERSRKMTLQTLSRKVEDLIKEKNTLWSPFGQERIKPLELLLEVTQIFDKNQFNINVNEFILTEKETSNPIIELNGFFKSDLGLGYHHKEWQQLEERIKESPLLTLAEPPLTISSADSNQGIKFEVKLQKKSLVDQTQGVQ